MEDKPRPLSDSSFASTSFAEKGIKEEDFDDEQDGDVCDQSGGGVGGHESSSDRKKRLFSKELRCMMFGFGDDQNPYTESVDLLEDLVIHYITEMTSAAMDVGKTGRVTAEDIMHLTRNDPKKFVRVNELLSMNEELKKARKAFDEVKYAASV